MRKIIALVMATLMVVAMAFSAFAVSITINQDSSFGSGSATSGTASKFTWYRIFTATMDPSSGTTTGGGSGSYWYTSGSSNEIDASSYGKVAYTASLEVANLLGTYSSGTGWEAKSGQTWFKLTPIAGTDPQTFSVEWIGVTDDNGSAIRAAADWLLENVAPELLDSEKGKFSYEDGAWTADVGTAGYYLIESGVGRNLIAATTDIEIKEKNVYPSLDKTQKDEDHASGTYGDTDVVVAIGDVVSYQIEVTVPATAKAGDIIEVADTATPGLNYNNDVEAKDEDNNTVTLEEGKYPAGANETWRKRFIVTEDLVGKKVYFTFTMTVNSDAFTDTEKKNEAKLEYGNSGTSFYETLPDEVFYKYYYASILKVDGKTNEVLPGVVFTLYEAASGTEPTEFKVTEVSSGSYLADPSGTSATVVTNASGTIIIRGLDNDKTYTLVEVSTLEGYNLLSGSVVLNLEEDTGSGTNYTTPLNTIKNFSGTVLPSTGGIGTTIFYIVGGLLAVGAGVVLVAKKRMGKVED